MNRAYILYIILGLLYGIIIWTEDILLNSYINQNYSNNLIGLDFTITQSNIKALFISFILTFLYIMKDYYQLNK